MRRLVFALFLFDAFYCAGVARPRLLNRIDFESEAGFQCWPGDVTVDLDGEDAAEGKTSLVVSPDNNFVVYFWQKYVPGHTCRLTLRMKCDAPLNARMTLSVNFKKADGSPASTFSHPLRDDVPSDGAWHEVSCTFKVPSDAVRGQTMLALFRANATIHADDLRLYDLDAEEDGSWKKPVARPRAKTKAADAHQGDRQSFPVRFNPTIAPGVVTTRPALTTSQKLLSLPRSQSGYGFVGNIERRASISPDAVSSIHFLPINNSRKPVFCLAVPKDVEVLGAYRDLQMAERGTQAFEGISHRVYAFTQGPRSSKYTFYWKLTATRPEGSSFNVYYWGEYRDKGVVTAQKPRALPTDVVSIPAVKRDLNLPIYWSMPSDFFASYPDVAGLRRSGFNTLDMWTYVEPGEDWGWKLVDATIEKCRAAGVRPVAWIREWWWEKGRASPEGQATLSDGTKTPKALCLSYRGAEYQKLLKQGRALIDRGLYFHTVDPEMYGSGIVAGKGAGEVICYCAKCKAAYRRYLRGRAPSDALWNAFKCDRFAAFFREYREDMESYMKEKRIAGRFTFMIYNAYHRSFPGFSGYTDYRTSHSYLGTLEDPKAFVGVFDILAPMVYTDVYANYNPYDMLLPWRDTYVLDKIVEGRIPIAPILCPGYPFQRAFDCDTSAEMLKWNMLESISGGAKGFGFWGECPFDAKDMKALAEVVNAIAPFEDIVAEGRPDENISVPSVNAVAKRIRSSKGSLLFVSEYSTRPLTVTIRVPVTSARTLIDAATGRRLKELTPQDCTFTAKLGAERVRVFAAVRKESAR